MSHDQQPFTFSTTQRGFAIVEFRDYYGEKCSLQQSSLAGDDAIWLGIDDPEVKHLVPGHGWQEVEVPNGSMITSRMHLTREQVAELLPLLHAFAETGEVPAAMPAPCRQHQRIEALEKALHDAATSLETISRLAGRSHYVGDDGERIPTYMGATDQVRGYASARAGVARALLSTTQQEDSQKCGT